MHYAISGARSGLEATGTMTAVLGVAQRIGLLGKFPPKRIVERALGVAGVRHRTREPARNALTTLAHFGFGMGSGALFGAIYRRTRDLPAPSWLQGALFGAAVWTLSYQGWVPSLGIMPAPKHDRPGRPTSMFIAHVIYGATLGAELHARQA
jgi:hypothetical protein